MGIRGQTERIRLQAYGDVRPAFPGHQVGGVDVGHRAARLDAAHQQVTQGLEDALIQPLVGFIAGQQLADRAGRKARPRRSARESA